MKEVVFSVVQLNIIYHGSCFEGDFSQDVPQGKNNDIVSDDDVQLNQ